MPAADVAARFGVTETVVQKRLRLARVSPSVLAAFRKGDLSLEQIMAFAVSDDHAAQDSVLEHLSGWNRDPSTIRDALTSDEIPASDRRVKFSTLKAYEEADGAVRRDLFADGEEDGVFILDPVLLDSLVSKKLEKTATAVQAEGWKWVEVRASYDYSEWSRCERRYPEAEELSAELQEELDALTAEQDRLLESDDEDSEERLDAISRRIEEIEDREKFWTPETLGIAGAVVSIDYAGKAEIHRGLVRPEDRPSRRREQDAGQAADGAEKPVAALPAALTESLTLHRTAAMAAELMHRPDIALAALVHALAAQLFLNEFADNTCLQLRVTAQSFRGVETAPAKDALRIAREAWFERVPESADALWEWCITQDQSVLLDLLAFLHGGRHRCRAQESGPRGYSPPGSCGSAGAEPLPRHDEMVHAHGWELLRADHQGRHPAGFAGGEGSRCARVEQGKQSGPRRDRGAGNDGERVVAADTLDGERENMK
jgi:ParB family transcriptional regulator, chromosome partitioning protein